MNLVYNWLGSAKDLIDIGPPEIKATEDDPVHFPLSEGQLKLKRGQSANMKVSFYNNEDNAIENGEASITCGTSTEGQEISVVVTTTPISVGINEETTVAMLMKVPTDSPRASYPCEMLLSQTRKSFFIEVS